MVYGELDWDRASACLIGLKQMLELTIQNIMHCHSLLCRQPRSRIRLIMSLASFSAVEFLRKLLLISGVLGQVDTM